MNQPVLVLNANYEPLNLCDMRRAIGLILTGKAEMVANGRGFIHTAHASFPRPSVIRLGQIVHRPRPRVKLTKREIFRRDNYTCQYCGRQAAHLTIDHILPRRCGGQHRWDNLVTACAACNRRKGGHLLSEVTMHLRRQAAEPAATASYLFGRHTAENAEWQKYIEGW